MIDKDTVLVFDEFLINDNWEQDEFKALNEFCSENHYTYEVVAVSFFTKQVAVKIIGIWAMIKNDADNITETFKAH